MKQWEVTLVSRNSLATELNDLQKDKWTIFSVMWADESFVVVAWKEFN
jgi:hypothetical protein